MSWWLRGYNEEIRAAGPVVELAITVDDPAQVLGYELVHPKRPRALTYDEANALIDDEELGADMKWYIIDTSEYDDHQPYGDYQPTSRRDSDEDSDEADEDIIPQGMSGQQWYAINDLAERASREGIKPISFAEPTEERDVAAISLGDRHGLIDQEGDVLWTDGTITRFPETRLRNCAHCDHPAVAHHLGNGDSKCDGPFGGAGCNCSGYDEEYAPMGQGNPFNEHGVCVFCHRTNFKHYPNCLHVISQPDEDPPPDWQQDRPA